MIFNKKITKMPGLIASNGILHDQLMRSRRITATSARTNSGPLVRACGIAARRKPGEDDRKKGSGSRELWCSATVGEDALRLLIRRSRFSLAAIARTAPVTFLARREKELRSDKRSGPREQARLASSGGLVETTCGGKPMLEEVDECAEEGVLPSTRAVGGRGGSGRSHEAVVGNTRVHWNCHAGIRRGPAIR